MGDGVTDKIISMDQEFSSPVSKIHPIYQISIYQKIALDHAVFRSIKKNHQNRVVKVAAAIGVECNHILDHGTYLSIAA